MDVPVTYSAEVSVSTETMMHMLSNAFDCGWVNYWVRLVEIDFPDEPDWSWATDKQRAEWGTGVSKIYTAALCGGKLTIHGWEDDEHWIMDKASMLRGIKLMAKGSPRHFQDMVTDSHDAITGDVFVQFCSIGRHVYG